MNKNILVISLIAIIGQGVVAQSNNIEGNVGILTQRIPESRNFPRVQMATITQKSQSSKLNR